MRLPIRPSTTARRSMRALSSTAGTRPLRRRRMARRDGGRLSDGQPVSSDSEPVVTHEYRPGRGDHHAQGREGARLRSEHGRPRDIHLQGPTRTGDRHLARRGARREGQLLYRQPAFGQGAEPLHMQRRRGPASSRALRSTDSATSRWRASTARSTPRTSKVAVIFSDLAETGNFVVVERTGKPAAEQHTVGPSRQLPRCADRLPAA